MNAEFVQKMLEAKRLEAEALALLVPPKARRATACAVREFSNAVLDVLDGPGRHQSDRDRGARPIVIE